MFNTLYKAPSTVGQPCNTPIEHQPFSNYPQTIGPHLTAAATCCLLGCLDVSGGATAAAARSPTPASDQPLLLCRLPLLCRLLLLLLSCCNVTTGDLHIA